MKQSHVIFILVVVALTGILAACTGQDLGDVVKVKTPHKIAQETGLPATMSLNDSQVEYQRWLDGVKTDGAQWQANIEKSAELRNLLGQLTLTAFDTAATTVAGVPVIGAAMPALLGLAGLFVGRSNLMKEKQASYNKGLETGSALKGGEA